MSRCQTPIIVALDYSNANNALQLVKQLSPELCRLKVGKELFVAAGPELVRQLINLEFDVFLDLKFHDIPNTVANACTAVANLGIWMVNVHAQGGLKMMQAAQKALENFSGPKPILVAVTVLTSMQTADLNETGIPDVTEEHVLRLAQLAYQAGLDGLVCSANETALLRQKFPANFTLVTPGIRPIGYVTADDQQRIQTPKSAIENGSDYLVIGRPIIHAPNPLQAIETIINTLN